MLYKAITVPGEQYIAKKRPVFIFKCYQVLSEKKGDLFVCFSVFYTKYANQISSNVDYPAR